LVIVAVAVVGFNRLYDYSTTQGQSFWDSLRTPGMKDSK